MTAPAPVSVLEELLKQHQEDVVFVKNTQPGPTVHTVDATRNDGNIVWQGAGDPNGQDVQVVPKSLLGNVQFRNCLQLGVFEIVEDPAAAQAALVAQQTAWAEAEQKRRTADPESIFQDPTLDTHQKLVVEGAESKKEVHITECVAKPCTTSVILKPNEVGKVPPLCGAHTSLAAQFVAQEDESKPLIEGKPQLRWVRSSVGTPLG